MTPWSFWAPRYERLWAQRYSLRPTREAVRARLRRLAPARVLDAGCGTGQLCGEIAADFAADFAAGRLWIEGLDRTPAMIAVARRRRPALHFRVGDVSQLDPPATPYDAVVCTHAFPYLPEPADAMARLRAQLAPGGALLLAQACADSLYDRLFLAAVRLTTGPAQYHRRERLLTLAAPWFGAPVHEQRIRPYRWLPTLRLFEWHAPASRTPGPATGGAP